MSEMVLSTPSGELFMPVLNIDQIVQKREMVKRFYDAVMTRGIDFGVIPGTEKPALHKPGAEKLCSLFGLSVKPYIIEKVEDWTGADHGGEPMFYYHYRVGLWRGDHLITEAEGSCNSFESKYRYRKGERTCPACGMATIIKGKAEYGGGWICFAKKGGCGAKFSDNEPAIKDQVVGRVANPDVADAVNTIQKMALKRAYVAAVLLATGASEFFTQDVDDFQQGETSTPQDDRDDTRSTPQPTPQRPAQPAQSRAAAQPTGTVADAEKLWNETCDTAGMDADKDARHALLCGLLTDHFRAKDAKHPGLDPKKRISIQPAQFKLAAEMLRARANSPVSAPSGEPVKGASAPAQDNRPRCPVPECKNPYEMDCGCTRERIDEVLRDESAAALSGTLELDVPTTDQTAAAMAR